MVSGVVEFTVHVRVTNPMNNAQGASRRAMFARAGERKKIRTATATALLAVRNGVNHATPPCRVLLTRVAPRPLDSHDGLRAGMKPVVDAIAEAMCIDDADRVVAWDYAQERGAPKHYAVRVRITPGLGAVHEFRALPAATREALIKSIGHGSLVARVLEEIAA